MEIDTIGIDLGKTVFHLVFIFRLRQGGGPYIPDCPSPIIDSLWPV